MKNFLFIFVISAILIEAFLPVQISPVKGISLKNFAIYLTLLVLVLTEVAGGRLRTKKVPGITFLILILIGSAINVFYIQVSGKAPFSTIEHLIMFKAKIVDPLIIYLIIFLLIDNEKQGRQALLAVIVVFSVINILSFITTKFGLNYFIEPDISHIADAENRFHGAYKNSNQMAYFLCFLIPFLYYFYKESKEILMKLTLLLFMVSGIIAVLLSGSRGGVLSLCIVLVTTLLLYHDYKLGFVLLSFTALYVIITFLTGNEYVTKTIERFSVLTEGNLEKASNFRFEIWKGYLDIVSSKNHNLLIGTGFGMGQIFMYKTTGINASPHNFYLQIFVEFGLIGFTVWVFTLLRVGYYIVKVKTKESLLLKRVILVSFSIIIFGWCFTDLQSIVKYVSIVFAAGLSYLLLKEMNNSCT